MLCMESARTLGIWKAFSRRKKKEKEEHMGDGEEAPLWRLLRDERTDEVQQRLHRISTEEARGQAEAGRTLAALLKLCAWVGTEDRWIPDDVNEFTRLFRALAPDEYLEEDFETLLGGTLSRRGRLRFRRLLESNAGRAVDADLRAAAEAQAAHEAERRAAAEAHAAVAETHAAHEADLRTAAEAQAAHEAERRTAAEAQAAHEAERRAAAEAQAAVAGTHAAHEAERRTAAEAQAAHEAERRTAAEAHAAVAETHAAHEADLRTAAEAQAANEAERRAAAEAQAAVA